jgi:hypothetical protein
MCALAGQPPDMEATEAAALSLQMADCYKLTLQVTCHCTFQADLVLTPCWPGAPESLTGVTQHSACLTGVAQSVPVSHSNTQERERTVILFM